MLFFICIIKASCIYSFLAKTTIPEVSLSNLFTILIFLCKFILSKYDFTPFERLLSKWLKDGCTAILAGLFTANRYLSSYMISSGI